jgi:hypothetical protein
MVAQKSLYVKNLDGSSSPRKRTGLFQVMKHNQSASIIGALFD